VIEERSSLLVAFAGMESRRIQVRDATLHVAVTGHGPDIVVLTGGPGCVQYLEREEISPPGHRAFTHPEVWTKTITDACAASAAGREQARMPARSPG